MSDIEKAISPKCVEVFMTVFPDAKAMKFEVRMMEPTKENIIFFLKAAIDYLSGASTDNFKNLGTSNNKRFMPSAEYVKELEDNEKKISSLQSKLTDIERDRQALITKRNDLQEENRMLTLMLTDLISAVSHGRVSYTPEKVYIPQIGVEWLKNLTDVLNTQREE